RRIDMCVNVDRTGEDVLAGCVDPLDGRHAQALADLDDRAVLDQDVAGVAARGCHDGAVRYQRTHRARSFRGQAVSDAYLSGRRARKTPQWLRSSSMPPRSTSA